MNEQQIIELYLQVLSILDKIYENNTRCLKRKYDIYVQLKNSLK